MRTPTAAEIAAAQLKPDPIPADRLIVGVGDARSAELWRSRDGRESAWLWACGPCEYEWRFESDETARILEGEVFVDAGAGERRLQPGEEMRFTAGSQARWRIPERLVKLSLCEDHRPRPSLVSRALRKLGLASPA